MKQFLADDFLLESETAKTLYNDFAKDMPIFDFHCHLNPKEIYEDKKYEDLTEVWLGGDHYKWRMLRAYGVEERYITGDAKPYEKFLKYAEVIPYTIGNPLYHWTHLELKRYFGIDELLSPKTAESIYIRANEKLKTLTARRLIEMNNVKTIYTTDDPTDDLKYHKLLKEDESFSVVVMPTFRPDKAINVELATFIPWLEKLESVVGRKIKSFAELKKALEERIEFFDKIGCGCSDHALDTVSYCYGDEAEVEQIFQKGKRGEQLSEKEIAIYKSRLLVFLAAEYKKRGWAQQYHVGALRNNSNRMMKRLGPDTGFDAIEDKPIAENLSKLLSEEDELDALPKTILYFLNPAYTEVEAALMNCFQGAGVSGKIQLGSAWWFLDQKDGMERQIETLGQFGLLSKFVGMLTDSRSFLSYTRHEYFRRILCNKIGDKIEKGEYPNDIAFVGQIVKDICYNNAVAYFKK